MEIEKAEIPRHPLGDFCCQECGMVGGREEKGEGGGKERKRKRECEGGRERERVSLWHQLLDTRFSALVLVPAL